MYLLVFILFRSSIFSFFLRDGKNYVLILYFVTFFLQFQEAHVNTCYKHFYYFVTEFMLVNPKELEPLVEMTARVCKDS